MSRAVIVATSGGARLEHFVKSKTIKEISRDLKISRNTVRKNSAFDAAGSAQAEDLECGS
jgi:hypothetical protein